MLYVKIYVKYGENPPLWETQLNQKCYKYLEQNLIPQF